MYYYYNKKSNSVCGTNIEVNKPELVSITEEEHNEYISKMKQRYTASWVNGKFVYTPHTKTQEEITKELRKKREPLLKAFDIYKSNVDYGIITETDSQHNKIVAWYNKILDLNEDAINNPPSEITKYI